MSILIQKPGMLTTVQDLGRNGYRRFGINPNGVMDVAAACLINILLGNDDNEAVLEMHFPAPEIVFAADVVAAIGGGDFSPILDDHAVTNWRPFLAKKDSVLKFGRNAVGNRAYLAVSGGFKCDEWLGSSSTNLAAHLGGFYGRKLEKSDRIEANKTTKKKTFASGGQVSQSLIPFYSHFPTVRVIAGGEFENLTANGRELLLNQDFTISSNSNRMGFRLAGKPLNLSRPVELISSAVSFGTIQMLPDGQLIVLMADHQTSGGYPRIAHVITRDLPLLAQLGANDKVAFHLVEIAEAENLALEFEHDLNFLRAGCKFQANR